MIRPRLHSSGVMLHGSQVLFLGVVGKMAPHPCSTYNYLRETTSKSTFNYKKVTAT